MLPEQQQRILGYFIEEARDHLNTIEQGLLNLQSTLNDPEMINEVFRAAHSIKGGAAMLGLSSIQHTSHRLEDCFKVLKENPIQVDQKLESLFLGVSDTLKALLENLSGPFGLSEETANTLMSETEPVFQWLNEHLELLVQQASGGVDSSVSPAMQPAFADHSHTLTEIFMQRDFSVPEEEAPPQKPTPVVTKANDNWGEFQAQVLQTLREMLQLFKQGTTPENRQHLQQTCHQLVVLGQTFNLPKWCKLCEAAENAIANPDNSYLTLAKIVITEIKKSQELVLKGKESEIVISQQLEVLLSFPDVELFEVATDLPDEFAIGTTPSAKANNEAIANELAAPTRDNFVNTTNNNIASVPDLTVPVKQDKEIFTAKENSTPETSELFNFLPNNEDETVLTNQNLDPKGPEVGIAELNTLADLFEGETPELDETWQQEEILDINAANKLGIDTSSSNTEDADSDLADLLSFDEPTSIDESKQTIIQTEDFSLLFGESFLEKENSPAKPLKPSATNSETNNISQNDRNLSSSTNESLREFTEILQEYPGDIAPQDVVQDLLSLELDETNLLSLDELHQPDTEASFDDLFSETSNDSLLEEISPINFPQPESLSLDNPFTDLTENPLLSTSESTIDDLFDPQATVARDYDISADDLSNFWNEDAGAEPQLEFSSRVEQDVAKALEESLFTAAHDFLDDSELAQSSASPFEVKDFNLTFQPDDEQFDLMFEADAGDDLFADLASENTAISPADATELPVTEIRSLTPEESDVYEGLSLHSPLPATTLPPELDFTPEFTNQPSTDNTFGSFGDNDLFDVINDNSGDNPQLLFENINTTHSTYIQLDPSEIRISDTHELGLGDNLLSTSADLDLDLNESTEVQQRPANLDLFANIETAETTNDDVSNLDLGADLLETENDLELGLNESTEVQQRPANLDLFANVETAETTNGEFATLELGDDLLTTSDALELNFGEATELAQPENNLDLLANVESVEAKNDEVSGLDLGTDLLSTSDDLELNANEVTLVQSDNNLDLLANVETVEIANNEVSTLDLGHDLLSTSDALELNSNEAKLAHLENNLDLFANVETVETKNDEVSGLDLGTDLLTTSDDLELNFDEGTELAQPENNLDLLANFETAEKANDEVSELDLGTDLLGTVDNLELNFDEGTELAQSENNLDLSANIEPVETKNDEVSQLDLGDDLLAIADDLDLNFNEVTELAQPEINSEILETAETTLADSAELNLLDDLLATETILQAETKLEDAANTQDTDAAMSTTGYAYANNVVELDAANDFSASLENITQTDEVAIITEAELDVPPSTPEDEFAELETLLEEELASPLQEEDFAALEALLDADLNEEPSAAPLPVYPQQSQPPTAYNNANTATTSSELEDEFGDLEKLLAEADQTISHSPSIKSTPGKAARPATRRGARFEETMKVPVKQLDDMSNLVGELVVNRNTLEQDHERLRQSLDNLLIQVQQLSDVGARMQELYERSLLEASLLATRKHRESGGSSSDSNSDRGFSELEMDRFTPFHTLSQEMIEMIVRVRESASDIDFVTEETERVARQFRQATTQLQEGLTRARMVPFSQAIDRLRRGVRDNAIKYGKQVELMIEGGDTLIDKMILDHLTDPLTHMLNNAIAHGIETPEVRQAAGKNPVGEIKIRAFHQGNQTVISVGDDGAGIDTEKIKAKALKLGMLTGEEAKTITRIEIYNLLFHSGFSIKDEADEISGRGVGMDIVRSEISEVRGTVNTDSAIGKGTTFTIRLPLTLSICKALCCVSDKARIAFPMDGVEDTLDIPVKSIQQNADGQTFIAWRDTVLPFRPLKDLLAFNRQISRGSVYGGTRDDDMVSVVVVRSANNLLALQIDLVLSEQEIVIKQFEGPAPKPLGVAGATVLGDGRIMPIADVLEIMDIFQGRMSKQNGGIWQQKPAQTLPEVPVEKIDPTVLIVDDSITVRELLSLTFNKAGYRVEQARDGQEAWDKLRSGLPCDIVFCDIEMPRCDGLELLSRIQKDHNLNHLPIAMLTSRGADKHRQMAIQLGASGYFTKPYLEEALLEAAVRMLKGEKLILNTTA